MAEFTFCVALQAAILSTGAKDYQQAYQDAASENKPLVVLVGADWCPGCRTMKHSTMSRLEQGGQLAGVSYAAVNSDRNPGLARRLMQGSSIPQLILFAKSRGGWRRMQLTGAQDESRVRAMIHQGMALSAAEKSQPVKTAGAE